MRYTAYAGTYFGIPVRIHFTFPLILLAFGAEAYFSAGPVAAARAVLLIMAVFVCVVLHEFGHSLQVRRYGIVVRDIILLPIGGLARAERIPENPWQEIVVAISGPLVNFALAALFTLIIFIRGTPPSLEGDFVTDLLMINLVLGVFNLIPAFPMDGGRILRGLLALKLPYLKATRYARAVGQVIALAFVVIGFAYGAFVMLPIIAVFIFFGGTSEENMIRVKALLENRLVGDFLPKNAVMLGEGDTVADAALRLANVNTMAFPVTGNDGMLLGAVLKRDLRRAARQGGNDSSVRDLVTTDFPVLDADMPATQGYYTLKGKRRKFAGVAREDRFLGFVDFRSFLVEPS